MNNYEKIMALLMEGDELDPFETVQVAFYYQSEGKRIDLDVTHLPAEINELDVDVEFFTPYEGKFTESLSDLYNEE